MFKVVARRIRLVQQEGFALPAVVFLMVLLSGIAYLALLQANNSLALTYKQTYLNIAQTAAKGGVDYAQEQFNNDFGYNGTSEQNIMTTGSTAGYRTTFTVTVLSTSADGKTKTVKSEGKVYVPSSATTADASYVLIHKITATPGIPQQSLLYHWFKFNNNGLESITSNAKYDFDVLGGTGFTTSTLPHTKDGNTHSFGINPVPGEDFWRKEWTADNNDRFSGSGSLCFWAQSSDGDNDHGGDYYGERFLTLEGYGLNLPIAQIRLDIGPNRQTGNTWSLVNRFMLSDAEEWNSTPADVTNSGVGMDTVWHQHCVVSDNGNVTYYIDGAARATDYWDIFHNIFGNDIYLKEYSGGSWHSPHSRPNGWIDELMVWKIALTAPEISQLYAYATSTTPPPSPTPPSPTPPAPSSPPTTVSINNSVTGTGDSQFNFSGGWGTTTTAGAYQNDETYSNTTNAQYTVQFVGTQIAVYSMKNPNYGIAAYSIDGGAETMVDHYNSSRTFNFLAYTSPALVNGTHTLRVRVTGNKNASSSDKYIVADRVDITSTPAATPVDINDNTTGSGSSQFNYSAGWGYTTTAGAFNNDEHFNNTTNAQYTVQFVGTQIAVYSMKNPNYGIAAYSIDGGAETMADHYASARVFNFLAYTSPVLSSGTHTLRVRVTGNKNAASSSVFIPADKVTISP